MQVSNTPWDMRRGPVLVIVLLEKLVEQKWKAGRQIAEHTLTSPRIFNFTDPFAAKPYLQCLVNLPEILDLESFPALSPPASPAHIMHEL